MSQASFRIIEALERGADDDAVAMAQDAAQAGDADAQYMLAEWHLVGQRIPRDLGAARSLLRSARLGGNENAARMEIALTANGTGATADWGAALQLLRDAAARFGGAACEELALVESMALDEDGASVELPPPERLGRTWQIQRWKQFLSPQECAHLAMSAAELLGPSTVADPRTGKRMSHPVRDSSAAVIGPTRETLPVQAILRRLAMASGTRVSQGEPLTILHYTGGQRYREHMDALPHEPNQRIATALMYLNSGYHGGETHFPEAGLRIVPGGGDLILFANLRPDGTPDPRSRHAGLPVNQGAKWAATRWIRARPLDIWSGTDRA